MSTSTVRTYTCDKCKKTVTSMKDRVKGDNWFKLIIKVFFGCDKKDTFEMHVCSLECAYKAMKEHPDTICISWVKMDEVHLPED